MRGRGTEKWKLQIYNKFVLVSRYTYWWSLNQTWSLNKFKLAEKLRICWFNITTEGLCTFGRSMRKPYFSSTKRTICISTLSTFGFQNDFLAVFMAFALLLCLSNFYGVIKANTFGRIFSHSCHLLFFECRCATESGD